MDRVILSDSNVKSNESYRRYMIKNAQSITSLNQIRVQSEIGSSFGRERKRDAPPYLYKGPLSREEPRGYETSDLKTQYLNAYMAKAAKKRVSVSSDTAAYLKHLFL